MTEGGTSFLVRLGLTEKEARAYLALFASRGLDARSLSAQIGDTYPAIYRTVNGLLAKGWALATGHRPRVFTAVAPGQVAGRSRRERIAEVEEAAARLASLAAGGGAPAAEIAIAKGFSGALAAVEDVVLGSRENLFCVSPGEIDRETLQMLLRLLSRAGGAVEWYLNVGNRGDLAALARYQGLNTRALPVIPKARASGTRLEHLFLFSGRARLLTLNLAYREERLNREACHAILVADADIVRVQLEALVESTRVLAGRPVPAP